MRILIHDYAGHPFQVALSRQLAARGHIVQHAYFAGDLGPKGDLAAKPSDPPGLGFSPIEIGRPYDKVAFVRRQADDLRYGAALFRAIAAFGPDVVISGNTPTMAQIGALRAAHAAGGAFVHWVQDFYSIAVTSILRRKVGWPAAPVSATYRIIDRHVMRASDGIVLISEDFLAMARRWSGDGDKIVTVENWGALDVVEPGQRANAFALTHGFETGFSFLYSGTLGMKHNPELLLVLARAFRDRARVIVVAQGSGVEHLERARDAEGLDNLHLLPLQPVERLSDVLAIADVLVSVIEPDAGVFSVPSKVQSYFCAGKPVLLAAPMANLAARTVLARRAGRVVPADAPAGLVPVAEEMFADAGLRAEMGQRGRQYAIDHYDIDKVADRFTCVALDAIRRFRGLRAPRARDAGAATL